MGLTGVPLSSRQASAAELWYIQAPAMMPAAIGGFNSAMETAPGVCMHSHNAVPCSNASLVQIPVCCTTPRRRCIPQCTQGSTTQPSLPRHPRAGSCRPYQTAPSAQRPPLLAAAPGLHGPRRSVQGRRLLRRQLSCLCPCARHLSVAAAGPGPAGEWWHHGQAAWPAVHHARQHVSTCSDTCRLLD